MRVKEKNMYSKLNNMNFNDYKPLRDVIFTTLREAIVSGELKPGERLLEVKLADKMGVSRTPVREAIRKLELEGFVVMLPRKGAHVADLSVKDIANVLEIRAALDALATELAAQRMTDSELNDLKRIHEQFISHVARNNLQGAIKKDMEFHDAIYKAARNEKLVQVSGNLWEQVQRFRVVYMRDHNSAEAVINEHSEILEALSEKRIDAARDFAAKHIKQQKEKIISEITKSRA
jgi:DNA-binding GntR family transcriptional regulator